MPPAEKFEDLRVWQMARQIVSSVYRLSSVDGFSKDYALRDQIRRACISIPSNISEGFARRSNREFVQFLFIAKGSAAEVENQLYLALDQGYITQQEFNSVYEGLELLSKQLSKFITYLKKAG